jgi:hypothetical protein
MTNHLTEYHKCQEKALFHHDKSFQCALSSSKKSHRKCSELWHNEALEHFKHLSKAEQDIILAEEAKQMMTNFTKNLTNL